MTGQRSLPGASPSSRQRGFSLIVALMMLIVIIILGVSASQMAINEERGARNDRDRQIAFQAAEAAIKDAELEIYGSASPLCTVVGQINQGRMRPGTTTCFNQSSVAGYVINCSSTSGNVGLCVSDSTRPDSPAYLNVDFKADAAGGPTPRTVAYGTYTGRAYGTQATLGSGLPISIYPPRYIIEAVPKNTSVDSLTCDGCGAGAGSSNMFRVTAMGFGASPNSQVVLQAVVATQD